MAAENWNRRVWRLAGPIILANVSVPLLGAVDTAVVGHLPGPQSIGAVAVAALIFNFIYFGFNFLRMGTTGLTAQALGAGDAEEVR
ncbi:MAG: MATE family efflux transporter, partial [Proteobacteria bacterium]|nr:MATE family efflux transporter [Pseudomonadota bacterium]